LTPLEQDLRKRRERLLRLALSSIAKRHLVELQIELAQGIRDSEEKRRGLPARSEERVLWKTHDTLLRIIGDTLVWLILDAHSIRTLGKGPGRPASLIGQWDDFSLVLEAARHAGDSGTMVLICDVTNVLSTGDLVLFNQNHGIAVTECKNVSAEKLRNRRDDRVERQFRRGYALSQYLTTGESSLPEIPHPVPIPEGYSHTYRSFDFDVQAEHDWELLRAAVSEAQASGIGIAKNGAEFVYALRNDTPPPPPETLPFPTAPADRDAARMTFGFPQNFLKDPSTLQPPLTTWPLDIDQRIAVFEKDIWVCHGIPIDDFIGGIEGIDAEVVDVTQTGFIRVRSGGQKQQFGPRFIENALISFQRPSSVKEQILRSVVRVQEPDTLTPSPSFPTQFLVITRNETEEPSPDQGNAIPAVETHPDTTNDGEE
jgi:hypothetical protein